jgi:ankyrin repeat protein
MWAARTEGIDAMKVLLDAGATVDRRDRRNGWTALQHAIHTRAIHAVRLLLERGADPNASDHPGAPTPLLMASLEADPAVLKLLLAYGADPRVEGEWGDTPLTQAVSGGALSDIDRGLLGACHADTVRALLEHDRTLRLPDSAAGRQALMWARLHSRQASTREVVHGLATGNADGAPTRSGHGDRCREVLDLVNDGVAPTRAQR